MPRIGVTGETASNPSDVAANATNVGSNMGVNSHEQIFTPIQINKYSAGGPPGIEGPISGGTAFNGPFGWGAGHFGPTSMELNKYFPKIYGGDGSYWFNETDFTLMANNGTGSNGDQDLNIKKIDRGSVTSVQVNSLVGPLLLSGIGFDCGDRPAPAAGTFFFDENAPLDRTTWKTGPVVLKWDDERKVWEGGHQILCGVAASEIKAPTSPCDPETFMVDVFRSRSQAGADFPNLTNCDLLETLFVNNRDPSLSQEHIPGQVFVIVARVNYEWLPIWVGCSDSTDYCPPCVCLQCPGGGGGGGSTPNTDGPGDNPDDGTGGGYPENPGGGGGSPGTGE